MDIACLYTDVTLLTFTYNMTIYIFIHIYASNMYLIAITVLHTTVGPLNVYKKSEGQIM